MNLLSNDYLIFLLKIITSIPLILVVIKQIKLIRKFKQYNGLAYSRNMLLFITIILLVNSLVDSFLIYNFLVHNFASCIFNVLTAIAFYKLYFNKHNNEDHPKH